MSVKVNSESIPKLGEVANTATSVGTRDAFHVAVMLSICAAVRLLPGESVRVGHFHAHRCARSDRIGIVDPFLTEDVKRGQCFWVILDPGTTCNLRHHYDLNTEVAANVFNGMFPKSQEEDDDDGCSGCN